MGDNKETKEETRDTERSARESATAILKLIWVSVPLGTFNQMRIWEIFLSRVRSCAAQTVSLADFFDMLCRKMQVGSLAGKQEDRALVDDILSSPENVQMPILKELREHAQLCVLRVRVAQEQKKERYLEKEEGANENGLL